MSLNKDYAARKRKRHRRKVPRLRGTGEDMLAQVLATLTPLQETLLRIEGWAALPFKFWIGHVPAREVGWEHGQSEVRAVLLRIVGEPQERQVVRVAPDQKIPSTPFYRAGRLRWSKSWVSPAYKHREMITDVPIRDGAVVAVLSFPLPPDTIERGYLWHWPTTEAAILERAGIGLVGLHGEDCRVLRRAWFDHEGIRG